MNGQSCGKWSFSQCVPLGGNFTITVKDAVQFSGQPRLFVIINNRGRGTFSSENCRRENNRWICDFNISIPASSIGGPGTYRFQTTQSPGAMTCAQGVFTIIDPAIDNTPPKLSCPDITVSAAANSCGTNVNYGNLVTGETCQFSTIASPSSGSFFAVGSNTVNVEAFDWAGNKSTCSFNVRVTDNGKPSITCPPEVKTVTEEFSCSARLVDLGTPTGSDDCSSFTFSNNAPNTFPLGTTNVLWTIRDAGGNTASCTQKVTVEDDKEPVPDLSSLHTISGQCSATVTNTPTATDNCAGTINGTTNDPLTYSTQGIHIITWTFDDGNGNVETQTQEVLIEDDKYPVADVATLPTIRGECSVTVSTIPTATDNCDGTIKGEPNDPLTYNTPGTYTIFWTYEDSKSNVGGQSQTVIVEDNSPPVPDLPSLPTIRAECSATIAKPTATDNCAGTIEGTTNDALTYSTLGTYIITWSYDDGNGNSITQAQTIIIEDLSKPVPDVSFLPTITEECSASVSPPTASDVCEGTIIATTNDPTSFSVQGNYTINWTYDDGNGNSETQTQTVIIKDISKPVPDLATLPTITEECSASVTPPTATDNCAGNIQGTTNDPLSYSTQGTHIITWSFDDGNGNIATQTQTVVVKDISKPVPDATTLPTVTDQCSATVSTTPTATDNCTGQTIIGTTNDPLSYSTQGTHIITWSFDDGSGNVETQTQTVIIDDVTDPIPVQNVLPILKAECSVSVSSAPTATDNCEGTIIGTTSDPLSYSSQGTHIITWTFDDGNGNAVTQTQTVIIDDGTAPVPDVATLPTINGLCEAGLEPPFATDNCAGQVIGTTSDPLYFDKEGTYTITWVYDDGNGNSSSQDQTIIIEDDIAPVPDRERLPTIRRQCSATVSNVPTATDRCAGTIQGTTSDPLTYNTQGVHIITWTFDDGNGNTATQTQRIVIRDRQAPVPDQANLPTLTGSCSVMVTNFPTATDNCAGSITATTDSPLEFDQEGTYAIVWNYDDGNGNTNIQTQWVIIGGDAAPNALCRDLSIPLGNAESLRINSIDIDDGSYDDCSSVRLLISPAGGSIFGTGLPPSSSVDLYCKDGKEQNVMLSVTNEKGNTAYCQAKVTLLGTDTDNDGILDNCDNCPDTYNPDQKDSNNNGQGDVCEENSNPDPNPGGWGGWSLKKQGQEEFNIITELKAFPNPFKEDLNLSFNLSQEEKTTIEIFNIQGQRVHTLLSELAPKGEHRVLWDGKDQNGQSMPAGIYLIRLRAGKALINHKVMLQR